MKTAINWHSNYINEYRCARMWHSKLNYHGDGNTNVSKRITNSFLTNVGYEETSVTKLTYRNTNSDVLNRHNGTVARILMTVAVSCPPFVMNSDCFYYYL